MRTLTLDPTEIGLLRAVSFDETGPTIYALMITGKDEHHIPLARAAIVSFLAQTWGNRRLVVVNDGSYHFNVPGVPEDRILQIQVGERQVLGALRNLALDQVPKDAVWVQWDDDDWHHPSLMKDQHQVLSEKAVDTCFLAFQLKYAFPLDAGWVDYHPGGFAGTLMSRHFANLRYPLTARSEDSDYCRQVKKQHTWYSWESSPHYYLRFYHGHNTWELDHFRGLHGSPGERHMPDECARYLEEILPIYEELR